MKLVLNLPIAFAPKSSDALNAEVLRVLLDAMVDVNLAYMTECKFPSIYSSGVRYGRTKWWEPIPAVIKRGYGDCKSLAPWYVAECARKGIAATPVFRFVVNPATGAKDFHILVQTDRGFEDPSKVLGMGVNENARR